MMGKHKNRLPPFVPLLISTLDTPAWRAMSHGSKSLYVALKRRVQNGRNRAYISYRTAERELRSSRRKIGEWFRELQHYGFIVLAVPGSLGVEGKGKSPHWRLTELGQVGRASADGMFEPPTNDFLRWNGTRFKKQNPGSYVGNGAVPTWETPSVPTSETLKPEGVSYGVAIEDDESGSCGVAITRFTTTGGSGGGTNSTTSTDTSGGLLGEENNSRPRVTSRRAS